MILEVTDYWIKTIKKYQIEIENDGQLTQEQESTSAKWL